MKKIYENVDLKVLFFQTDDIITSSTDDASDNVGNMPEFPEFMN